MKSAKFYTTTIASKVIKLMSGLNVAQAKLVLQEAHRQLDASAVLAVDENKVSPEILEAIAEVEGTPAGQP